MRRSMAMVVIAASAALVLTGTAAASAGRVSQAPAARYRWHNDIVSTTFWVGEIFEPNNPNGSQVISTYDGHWEQHYGGCDGVIRNGKCQTERRFAYNGWFPLHMTPQQNPFYLDVPFDDVNDPIGAAERGRVVPWAHQKPYSSWLSHPNKSIMKNRWVEITRAGQTCYGQVEDAGPGRYHDAAYVFGGARPANKLYNGAGMDVSPALTGCLHFPELNGDNAHVSWRFVDFGAVPKGPWRRLVTR